MLCVKFVHKRGATGSNLKGFAEVPDSFETSNILTVKQLFHRKRLAIQMLLRIFLFSHLEI